MKILAIDTSSNVCSVCILEDTNLIKELMVNDGKTHSDNLMPLIDKLFKETNLHLYNIDLIACSKGPGSFTGIRIGIATAKALAMVHNIPIIGVSSLDGLAYNVKNPTSTIISLIDARNNQVYCGIFDSNYNLLEDYIADDINVVLENINKYEDITFVGDASTIYKDKLNGNFYNDNLQNSISIGLCAFNKFKNGFSENADLVLPMYLRKSQAERMKDLKGDK